MPKKIDPTLVHLQHVDIPGVTECTDFGDDVVGVRATQALVSVECVECLERRRDELLKRVEAIDAIIMMRKQKQQGAS